jgi:hypothetical protein
LLSFAVSSSLQAEAVPSAGRTCDEVSDGTSDETLSGTWSSFESVSGWDVSCKSSWEAGGKLLLASAAGRAVAAEDDSGSQRQTSPHRRQFMGNNSDNNLDRNLVESQLGQTKRGAGLLQITQPL